uniref:Uncharacterized protein n=1 Tax=Glossina austeni TaxID=7395 RepID=A0A1A9VYK5_GLOAU
MLRPLLPLLKEDIPWYVCSPPLLLETFNVRIVYVAAPHRLYGQNVATEDQMSPLLNERYGYYENEEERFYLNQNAHAVEINLPLKTWAADTHSKQKIKKRDSASSGNLAADTQVIKYLSKLSLDQVVLVKAIEVRQNRLMADVIMEDGKNIIDLLKEQEFVKGRDVEYMRTMLDKEKPNVLEYIETVDLTLEDEEDRGDYGNTSITAECREISKDIAEPPALSQKCCLKLPENCLNWPEKAEEKFQDIAATGETIFSVGLWEPAADHAKVYLLIDGQNINDELEKLCERKPPTLNLDMSNSFTTTSLQTSISDMGV